MYALECMSMSCNSSPYLLCHGHNILCTTPDHLLMHSHSDRSNSHLELCVLLRAAVHPVALMCVIGLMNGHGCFDWQKQMACWQSFMVVASVDTPRAESD